MAEDCGEGRRQTSDTSHAEEYSSKESSQKENVTMAGGMSKPVMKKAEQFEDNPNNQLELPTHLGGGQGHDTRLDSVSSSSIELNEGHKRKLLVPKDGDEVIELVASAVLHDLQKQVDMLQEKLRQSDKEKQQLLVEIGRLQFLDKSEQRKSYTASVAYRARTGPLQEPSSALQQRLLEISNSLSEAELRKIKFLARHKLDPFQQRKIREGFELFEELKTNGELSCAYVRELLEGIQRLDLVEKLGEPSLGSAETVHIETDRMYRMDSSETRSNSTVGQSVSFVSTHESIEWELSSATPKDRPPTQLVPLDQQSGPDVAGNSSFTRRSQDRGLSKESLHQEEAASAENLVLVATRNSGLPSPYLAASVNEADNGFLLEEESTEARNASCNAGNQQTANIGAVLVEPRVLASCVHLCSLVLQLLESIEGQGERERIDIETTEGQTESGQQVVEVVPQPFELPLPCTIQSLDSNYNSTPEVLQAVARAFARRQELEGEEASVNGARARRCCTCASREILLEGSICGRCFQRRNMGPSSQPEEHCCNCCEITGESQVDSGYRMPETSRPDSVHDECCICLTEDAFRGCYFLPCSHKVHIICLFAMIVGGELDCPSCGYQFLRRN